jgi:cell division protein FtsI (penicillin-binding protein 3)
VARTDPPADATGSPLPVPKVNHAAAVARRDTGSGLPVASGPALLKPTPAVAAVLPDPPHRYARRAAVIARLAAVFITLGLAAVMGRVVQLQIVPPPKIARLIGSQTSQMALPARRGPLLDRTGRVIATTRVTHRLFVDPLLIEEAGTFSERVGYTLGYDPVEIEKTISQRLNSRYVVIDPDVSEERMALLKNFHPSGLATQPWLDRTYPHGSLAGQVVGFVGFEGQGLEGVERVFQKEVTGHRGRIRYLRDAEHRPLWVVSDAYQPPADGHAVRLSLDLTVQLIAERELRATCEEFAAESGQIIVMQPYTGEVLAMANCPTFDPNDLATSKAAQRRNRCVTDAFEPGSTFKPFIWSIATEGGYAKAQEIIDCGPGFYVAKSGRKLHDAHGHGRITWDDVLVKSSNIGMAIVGQRMGPAKLFEAMQRFGFGRVTGSGLPGESPGIVNPLKKWSGYSETSVTMGQEVAVTPMQVATAFCVFANGGMLVTPSLIALEPDEPLAAAPIYERVLSQWAADRTRHVLRRVVTDGTGRKVDSPAFDIFGKTGTAQVPDRKHGGYMEGQYVAGFVGGAPYDHPRIVVACFIQRPDKRKGHYGGIVAGPAVRRVIEQTLVYLGTQPSEPQPIARPTLLARQ